MIGIFLYGIAVFSLVCGALGLLAWGIVNERRDRTRFRQSTEVFGEAAARKIAGPEGMPK
jgi:hypothetical protein